MDTTSVTYASIRNSACLVCGKGFSTPRAGKLYCSSKCKQFSFYHRDEIHAIREANMGINESIVVLKLKEFNEYNSIVALLAEMKELVKRRDSSYRPFEEDHDKRLQELKVILSDDIRHLPLKKLSIEKWTFIKSINLHLKKKDLYKVISGLEGNFFALLDQISLNKSILKSHPIRVQYEKHLEKLVLGKIKIV